MVQDKIGRDFTYPLVYIYIFFPKGVVPEPESQVSQAGTKWRMSGSTAAAAAAAAKERRCDD